MTTNAIKSGQVTLDGIIVNRLGFGAMRITGEGIWGEPADHQGAIAVLRRAVELGINFIDTADAYGPEVSERLIKEALHSYDGIVIATKGGMTRQGPGLWGQDGSPNHLRQAVAGSLERLGIAATDLYQLHRPDPAVPFETSLQALIDLKNEGKIKHIGLSSVTLDQLKKALEMTEVVSVQNKYNVIGNDTVGAKNISNVVGLADSEAVLDYCTAHKIAFIPYSPIGGHGADLSALESIAAKHHADVQQIALAWLLARSPIILPIPGTGSVKHLEDNVAAVDIKLDEDDLAKLS